MSDVTRAIHSAMTLRPFSSGSQERKFDAALKRVDVVSAMDAVIQALRAMNRRIPRSERARLSRLGTAAIEVLRRELVCLVQAGPEAEPSSTEREREASTGSRHTEGEQQVQLLLLSPSVAILDFGCMLLPLFVSPALSRRIDAGAFRVGLETVFHRVGQQGVLDPVFQSARPASRTKSPTRAKCTGANVSRRKT